MNTDIRLHLIVQTQNLRKKKTFWLSLCALSKHMFLNNHEPEKIFLQVNESML